MGQSTPAPRILNAEQEHARLRFAVVLLLGLSFVLLFSVIRAWLQTGSELLVSFSLSLSCLLATPLALGISWAAEQWLKRVWPSGYRFLLDEAVLVVEQPEAEPIRFTKGESLSHLAWYFSLRGYKRGGRERRVSENWFCLACQLRQAEQSVIVYTYAPAAETEQLRQKYADSRPFHKISPPEVYEQKGLAGRWQPPSRPESIPAQVLSGKNGRYWLAEQRRWREGLELPPKEFSLFLNYLQSGLLPVAGSP